MFFFSPGDFCFFFFFSLFSFRPVSGGFPGSPFSPRRLLWLSGIRSSDCITRIGVPSRKGDGKEK